MKFPSFPSQPILSRLVLGIAAASLISPVMAAPGFSAPDDEFQGRVATATSVVYPGTVLKLTGTGFKAGQQVQFLYEGQSLAGEPVAADAEGKFSVESVIPKSAVPGRHPVLVSVTAPSAALVHILKISPDLPLSGARQFNIASEKTIAGVYQSGYSQKTNKLFIASAVGRPPVRESVLAKLDGTTLKVEGQVTPASAPARRAADGTEQDGGVYAVHGVGVDDANGNVWVSNTRQNTVAVYRQSDLTLVKQFEPGAVSHPRDVLIDQGSGKAFVNAARGENVEVFDTKTLEKIASITLQPAGRTAGAGRFAAQSFATMGMALDAVSGKLFVVGSNGDVATIDPATHTVEKVVALKGVVSAMSVAYDAVTHRLFVAAQGSDNVVIADADKGEVLHDVKVGAGALSIAFDPVGRLAYVANRGSGTLTVLDADGRIVANLRGGPMPNHVAVTPEGVIYALNKGQADAADGNHIRRIQPK